MGGIESLGVCGLVVDHTHCCYVVHYQSFLSIEQVLTTVITTVTIKEKLYISHEYSLTRIMSGQALL